MTSCPLLHFVPVNGSTTDYLTCPVRSTRGEGLWGSGIRGREGRLLSVTTDLEQTLRSSFFNRVRKTAKSDYYEGRLISIAHSEISRKRDRVFKQTKVGSKVQYFSYKLTYLFFDIVALSFNTFFPK